MGKEHRVGGGKKWERPSKRGKGPGKKSERRETRVRACEVDLLREVERRVLTKKLNFLCRRKKTEEEEVKKKKKKPSPTPIYL